MDTTMWQAGVGALSAPPLVTRACRQAMPDEELVHRCGRGETDALQELARRYQPQIARHAYRLLGSTEDAEDVALDVFVRVWRHASRFERRSSVSTWLYRIATNLARDVHDRRVSHPQAPWEEAEKPPAAACGSAEDAALRRLEHEEQARRLRRCLAQVGDTDRVLLVMYYLEDRDYEEMQAATGLSYGVVKARLARSRRRLRSMMDRP